MLPKPKKSLGQNWLKSPTALATMTAAAELTAEDTVLEIGPGMGILTEQLLATPAKKVITVEKDDRLITVLQEKFKTEIEIGRLEIIHGDILELGFEKLDLEGKSWKLVANLPYYITGQLLRLALEGQNTPQSIVVMLQKEVAERIVARDGKESLLSISIKAFGEPKYLKTVPRGAFYPVPNVDSAILGIFKIKPFANSAKFFEILHRGFTHKRKLLKNNLLCSTATLAACKIEPSARAEDLSLSDWQCLTQQL
jgi:16S rRNA (adenine1518-N6/adenine1519-N6)-dimethyltransferase